MNPDEANLLTWIFLGSTPPGDLNKFTPEVSDVITAVKIFDGENWVDLPKFPRDIIALTKINHKRAGYLLEKWTEKGWYDYGVAVDLGWLTDAGREAAVEAWRERREPLRKPGAHAVSRLMGGCALANQSCDRCGKETISTTMSWFNLQMICMDCDEKERKHPDYVRAREAEQASLDHGETNFPGIGKPADL